MKEQVGVTTGKFIAGLIIAILVSCAVSAAVCPCASATTMWSKTYGGTGTDYGYPVIQTSDGGYAMAGGTYSFGAGDRDFYFVKTDEFGVVPEGLTVGVMVLLSTVAVIVSTRYFRKRPKIKKCSQVKL